MPLTKAEIEKLLEGTTKGPWNNGKMGLITSSKNQIVVSANKLTDSDCALIAATPDLAQTCLDLYARVEELEKEREACLAFCKAQNGLPHCKNCGLGDKSDDWSPSIQACSVDNPDCESCT